MGYRGQIERGLEDCQRPVFGGTEEWRTECITERREWRLLQLSIEGFTKQLPFSPSSILCLPPLSPQLRLVWMEGAVQSEEMPTFANPPLILGDHHWVGRGDGGWQHWVARLSLYCVQNVPAGKEDALAEW